MTAFRSRLDASVRQLVGRLRWSARSRRHATIAAVIPLILAGWWLLSVVSGVPSPSALRHLRVLGGKGWCDEQPVACAVSKSMLTALAVSLVGLVAFSWWRGRAIARYGRIAREWPHDLFDWLSGNAAPPRTLGRDDLIATITRNLRGVGRDDLRPQVVRGDSGSGKTTLLIELARRLSLEAVLVVPVSLRNAGSTVDIVELAKGRFVALLEEESTAPGRAARAWKQLCQHGRVVILADGLDEITTRSVLERDEIARRALERVRRRGVGLVATTRASLWRSGVEAAMHELEPLPEECWVPYLQDRVTALPAADRKRLAALIEGADLGGRPVYLNLLAQLYDLAAESLDSLIAVPAADEPAAIVRWRLLDAYVEATRQTALRARDGELLVARTMRDLGWVAFAMLRLNTREASLAEIADALKGLQRAPSPQAVAYAVDGAGQWGLVHAFERKEELRLRFAHADLQSHLAANLLETEPALLPKLHERSFTSEYAGAVTLYCWRGLPSTERSREACAALLERSRSSREMLPEDARLPSVATAAEILSLAGIAAEADLGTEVAAEARAAWAAAAYRSRLASIPSLRGLGIPDAYATLWSITAEPQYDLRFAAAAALMEEPEKALEGLRDKVSECLHIASGHGDWDSRELRDVSILGWILPSWESLADASAGELSEYCWKLAEVAVRRDVHVGFEASLCQGFKLDAYARPEQAPDERALDLLGRVRFWYSAVSVIHALTIRSISTPSHRVRDALHKVRGAPPDTHPFVDRAAELGLRAIEQQDWRPYVWRDESEAIAGDARWLQPAAAQLLADIVITLNLTERDGWGHRPQVIQRQYQERRLPRCLSESRDRAELRQGASATQGQDGSGHEPDHDTQCCDFNLCPYPPPWSTGARGDFARAFCRRQQAIAHGERRIPLRHRVALPWQPDLKRDELVAFWEWMERRAEF